MKAGVEAGDLRHAGQPLGDRLDRREVVRLMQRRQRHRARAARRGPPASRRRARVTRAAVDDAMADAEHARAAVPDAQPGRRARRAPRGASRTSARSSAARRGVRPSPSLAENRGDVPMPSIWPRASSCQAVDSRPPVDAELQARRAGVEDEGVVVHVAPSLASSRLTAVRCRRACAASMATRAARDPRAHAVGAAGQDDRHARAEHQAGAVGVGEEA